MYGSKVDLKEARQESGKERKNTNVAIEKCCILVLLMYLYVMAKNLPFKYNYLHPPTLQLMYIFYEII